MGRQKRAEECEGADCRHGRREALAGAGRKARGRQVWERRRRRWAGPTALVVGLCVGAALPAVLVSMCSWRRAREAGSRALQSGARRRVARCASVPCWAYTWAPARRRGHQGGAPWRRPPSLPTKRFFFHRHARSHSLATHHQPCSIGRSPSAVIISNGPSAFGHARSARSPHSSLIHGGTRVRAGQSRRQPMRQP